MSAISPRLRTILLVATVAVPMSGGLYAQQVQPASGQPGPVVTVTGTAPADLNGLPAGPEIEGFISAHKGDRVQITTAGGPKTVVYISEATRIRSAGGFLGARKTKLGPDALLNGLPVSIKTVQWSDNLVASQIALKSRDLKTAAMIRNGTDQRFEEQAATVESLRGRMGDIDKYNVKGVTNVHFDIGKTDLSARDKAALCDAASSAQGMENALMLVVGYTDSTGGDDINQELSEKRASRVINYLQQTCGWKPYRMLTPTGMAKADPLASNATAAGKAQNRRVAVNVLVSKSVDGL